MKSKRIFSMTLALVIFGFLAANSAHAGIATTGDVDPDDPATWTSGTNGYVGNTADGTMTIDLDSDVIGNDGVIGYNSGVTGTATVTGTGSTWTNTYDIYLGFHGSGTLNITSGGDVSNSIAYLAYQPGSTGTATVDGAGSTWTNSNNLRVGGSGNGTLNIQNGGAVSNRTGYMGYFSGSTGMVTVDGPGSTWTNNQDLYIGTSTATGTLNITGGGAVTTAGTTELYSLATINFNNGTLTTGGLIAASANLTGTGTINTHSLVSDVDLVFDTTHGLNQTININDNPGQNITVNLNVNGSGSMGAGHGDVGTMSISDAIVVASTKGYLGYKFGSNGTATVTGAGSAWNNSSLLAVGYKGNGTLNITTGGAVSSSHGFIGYFSSSTGDVTVDGDGSTWTNSSVLFVGYNGSGTLNITGGGAVSNTDGNIGYKSGTTGTVTVDGPGSTWTNTGYLHVGGRFTSDTGTGTLNITGGSVVTAGGDTRVGGYSGATGTVTVDGAGSTWTNSSDLYVGDEGIGTLNIDNGGAVTVGGNLSINSLSTLDVLLASTSDPLLDVAGSNAYLDGMLSVDLADGFTLSRGDLFTLIDLTDISKTLTGTFIGLAQGDSVGIFDSLDLFISYAGGDGNDVVLYTYLPGDFDGDGDVDGVDFSHWQTGYPTASGASLADGDADGDGDVDGADFGLWQENYPTNLGGTTMIPEPATLGLLLMGGLALLKRRK